MNTNNMKNRKVQLISYPDTLGENLIDLKKVLDTFFVGVIDSVHILPFYPSSNDRGFAPLTHRKIDPVFGEEKDLQEISKKYNVMADLIVNHVSVESRYFQNYLKCGGRSKYRNYFIKAKDFSRRFYFKPKSKFLRFFWTMIGQTATIVRNFDFIFHKHGVNRLILKKIYRPRPGSPFVKFVRNDKKALYIWCTFSPCQVDLNIDSRGVRRKFKRDIEYLSKLGVKFLRLDAVGYVGKRRGTNNFLIPKTIRFIKWIADVAHDNKMIVIPEIHFSYKEQMSLIKLKEVDYVYDFALPFLTLNALYTGNTYYLKNWIKKRPLNSITNLDTHDGIGVIDIIGLLPAEEIKKTSQQVFLQGGNATTRASGNNSDNVDVYQINSTYYSALGQNDRAYIAARALQIFLPGIPQIYYVGLLAGKNDEALLEKTKNGRDINRHAYSIREIEEEIKRPVVKKIFTLCKLRNTHSAFMGKFELGNTPNGIIEIYWKHKKESLLLKLNLKNYKTEVIDGNNKILFSN